MVLSMVVLVIGCEAETETVIEEFAEKEKIIEEIIENEEVTTERGEQTVEEKNVDEVFNEKGTEKLEKMFKSDELVNKIFGYEERFSQNSYAGDMDANEQVEFKEGSGDVNVLISAPHTTSHIRDMEVKYAEIYTGSLALLIQEITGAHIIFNTYEGEDANYVIGGKYKEKIGEIIEEYNIDLVLDLHGAARSRDFELELGTDYGETVRDDWVQQMKSSLSNNGIEEVRENDTFAASGEGSVTHHTWNQYHTEAMQLEIHKNFRNPREDVESYYSLLNSLVFFVENID